MPPKSILKKASPSSSQDVDPRRERHLTTALHHANLIQQQKDAEKLIIDSVLQLLELPSSADADPARPSPTDSAEFKRLVSIFQPHDYDELIEERNAAKLCGYVLCPKPPMKDKSGGKFKIVLSQENGLKILPKDKVELWCSEDCARRALYIKVQLAEEPATVRRAGLSQEIELLEEQQQPTFTAALPFRLASEQTAPGRAGSGLERDISSLSIADEQGLPSDSVGGLVKPEVVEKRVRTTPVPPSLPEGRSVHAFIEGHETRDVSMRSDPAHDHEEDRDWDI
jgi:RNA polymerase II-associated protein 2